MTRDDEISPVSASVHGTLLAAGVMMGRRLECDEGRSGGGRGVRRARRGR